MAQTSKHPKRIGGMAFDAELHGLIQRISERNGVSTSHALRSCAGVGRKVLEDPPLRAKVEKAAQDYSSSPRAVYRDAIRCGAGRYDHQQAGTRPMPLKQPPAKYPERIGGIAFSAEDHEAFRRISTSRDISLPQVVRASADIGAAEYEDDRLRQRIEEIALKRGQPERDVVYGSIELGVDEAVSKLRVRRPLLIRDALGGEHARVDRGLSNYINAIMEPFQPESLPDAHSPMKLRADLLEHIDLMEQDPDDDWPHYGWSGTGNELLGLYEACRKSPQDDHDRELARYLGDLFANEVALHRRQQEAKRRREEQVLELRGPQMDDD